MIILDFWEDYTVTGSRISLALEARGWPPCTIPHERKIVCFSLAHPFPIKLEIYVAFKDKAQDAIFAERSCVPGGECTYKPAFPFGHWNGRMPFNIVYPVSRCRVGAPRDMACPNKPIPFLSGWASGEYEKLSAHPAPAKHANVSMATTTTTAAAEAFQEVRNEGGCLALPVLSKDRDKGDDRNKVLEQKGLTAEDLDMLSGYAESLHQGGFASFKTHLQSGACVRRSESIMAGDRHAGLGSL
eukprot:TRINITY_DN67380_c0_g1_i2.p2 TRINITY_DN67380_c0_g1~~TRINITY_DN67380_c0_g1_i2.p2  ORF type:complete len:243 (+),score=50.42 TRINITY_DN67380_c0_g1_i2:195-923(+)